MNISNRSLPIDKFYLNAPENDPFSLNRYSFYSAFVQIRTGTQSAGSRWTHSNIVHETRAWLQTFDTFDTIILCGFQHNMRNEYIVIVYHPLYLA